MAAPTLLVVHTAVRRYVVQQNDVFAIRGINATAESADPSVVVVDLGAFLDGNDQSEQVQRHGLFVPLRRKHIVLTVAKVDLLEHSSPQALPPLLRRRLGQPWAVGAVVLGNELVMQLDLRAVARSVLCQ